MDARWIFLPAIIAVIFVSGCTVSDPTTLVALNPAVSQFVKDHPNASIQIVNYKGSEITQNVANQIYNDCGKANVSASSLYMVNITDAESGLYITAWINWDDKAIECAYKAGSAGGGGNVVPAAGATNNNATTQPTKTKCEDTCANGYCTIWGLCVCDAGWNGKDCDERISAIPSGPVVQIDPVIASEFKLQEEVCGLLPENAMHLVQDYVAVKIPKGLDSLTNGGITITGNGFINVPSYEVQYFDVDITKDRYYWNCWMNGGPDTHLCIIPMTAQIKLENGTTITKTGAIHLTFSGMLKALAVKWPAPPATANTTSQSGSQNATSNDTSGQNSTASNETENQTSAGATPWNSIRQNTVPSGIQGYIIQTNEGCPPVPLIGEGGPTGVSGQSMRYWIPSSEVESKRCPEAQHTSVPTFTRSECELKFDESCPEMPGLELCGECPYSYFVQMITQDMQMKYHLELFPNLGQCRYCGGGQVCIHRGLCENTVCGSGTPSAPSSYYINCGQCSAGVPFKIDYKDRSEYSRVDCISNYNRCMNMKCGRILDNCR